jgi:hypothetical protein
MPRPPVSLQISLAPSDYAHARALLPHQVRVWRGQVAEILLTVDFHRSAGRFSARWEEGRELIFPLARSIAGARVVEVDYSAGVQAEISQRFFGGRPVPTKDYRGGPYYSYFFGLNAATHDHVLHVDSDMFFGGGCETWIGEALDRLQHRPEIFVIAPLPGAPSEDGTLRHLHGVRVPGDGLAYDFTEMSTRLFLVDRRRFQHDFGPLTPRRPGLKNQLKAWIDGNAPAELPENLITRQMHARGFVRHEFLGAAPGLWSLHPPYRGRDFYDRLPALIARIEAGDIPPAQRGDHDLNGSMVDWSEGIAALQRNRWWRRLAARWSPGGRSNR